MTDEVQVAWAVALLDAFSGAGVEDVIVSPGSRSTPFVLAAAEHPALRCHDIVDERSAAFYALGRARATGRPSLLLCTSGSAPAHYFPAVIEASAAFVPLLVLSADRPFELHGCGASQTVDQLRLYGDHVRWFVDLGAPEPGEAALLSLRRAAVRAVAESLGPTPGPVHVNARARKPLEPSAEALAAQTLRGEWPPVTRVLPTRTLPSDEAVEALGRACLEARDGVIVCGPASVGEREAGGAIRDLARRTGFALLSEATSQVRFVGPGASAEGPIGC